MCLKKKKLSPPLLFEDLSVLPVALWSLGFLSQVKELSSEGVRLSDWYNREPLEHDCIPSL